jgi:hypothetical protein
MLSIKDTQQFMVQKKTKKSFYKTQKVAGKTKKN